MSSLARVGTVLVLMALLLYRRLNIGVVLLVAGLFLMLLSNQISGLLTLLWLLLSDSSYYWMLSIVIGVSLLGTILKHLNKIPQLVSSLETLIGSRALVLPLLPMVIGTLPMPGGAYLSAPMVAQAASGTNLSREKKTVINHWFRHLLEFIFPLYPGFLFAAKMCDLDVRDFAYHTWPLAIIGSLSAFVLLFAREELGAIELKIDNPWKQLILALWPVGTVVALTLLIPREWLKLSFIFGSERYGDPFIVALCLTIVILAWRNSLFTWHLWKPWLEQAASGKIIIMVTGTFVFKHALEVTGLTKSLAPELTALGLPLPLLLGLIPFVVGLLVGYAVGFVGITFPVLLPLITTGGVINAKAAMWIYAAGWVGMMLSPAHICLVLTSEYFDSSWLAVLFDLALQGLIVAASAYLLAFGLS